MHLHDYSIASMQVLVSLPESSVPFPSDRQRESYGRVQSKPFNIRSYCRTNKTMSVYVLAVVVLGLDIKPWLSSGHRLAAFFVNVLWIRDPQPDELMAPK